MAEIKKGDLVRLKSGGPQMTVAEVGKLRSFSNGTFAKCRWFHGTAPVEDYFEIEVLTADASDHDPEGLLPQQS